jgi:peptidoglycan/LPS O-acetylase OafA/YrhL
MGIGALSAWLLFNKKEMLLNHFVFTSKMAQVFLSIIILIFFLGYSKSDVGEMLLPLPIGILLAWLILNLGVNEHRIFSLDNKILNYLGDISYGIYMLHVPLIYATTLIFQKLLMHHQNAFWYLPAYYVVLFTLIILAASFSYKFIEQPILAIHKKLKNTTPK